MSATDHLDDLAEALSAGRPLILLLGQDAWRTVKADTVLTAAYQRAGRVQEDAPNWGSFLSSEPLASDFYSWMAEVYAKQLQASWLETVAKLPLNAVFTSAIDPSLVRAFRCRGREVEAVLSKSDSPVAPRHRRNLHLTFLFGRAGERSESESPPKSIQELRKRNSLQATPLLARIPETVTPLGVLLIDGLTCGRDWLADETLYGVLSALQPRQVFWFGWDPSTEPSLDKSFLAELGEPAGPVVFVKERLATALGALELANKISLDGDAHYQVSDAITIRDVVLELTPSLRLKTSTAASIVDDSWLAPLAPLGDEATFAEFRNFHGYLEDVQRLVEGLRRGYAIGRTFETVLLDKTKRALANAGRSREPILIHGQSGSGKSLALARLAYEVRSAGKHPVLLASRSSRLPAVDELDEFCLLAEEAGAAATLLVCDVNLPASRYRDLLRGFLSRGRRVILVGSAYRLADTHPDRQSAGGDFLLEVPASLDEREAQDLTELIYRMTGTAYRFKDSSYILAALYRMLPDSRPRMAEGLAREARVAEDRLRSRGAPTPTSQTTYSTKLGAALAKAGLLDGQAILASQIEEFLGEISDTASRAIDFVMVPGKLNCAVPINLLMRAVAGNEDLVDISKLFSDIDLFRWSSNDEDDIVIHPRLQVEAEMIVSRRLGTADAEGQVAIRLLSNAHPAAYGSIERRFVLDLVHKLGPDGPFGVRYARSYLEIARALTAIREKRGILDPSLMLQEATLRRRVLRDAPNLQGIDSAAVLDEARLIVDLAIGEFSNNRGLKRICANLKVERAAIYGFRAVQRLKSGASLDEVWQFYEAARESARSAMFAADTYHAADVSVWVPNDLLSKDVAWSLDRRAEFIADIWDGLERVDVTQLDSDQREQFETRRVKVSQTLDDPALENDALSRLEEMGSRAGIFLQARRVGGSLSGKGTVAADLRAGALAAVQFLKQHRDKISDDARCLRYLLRASWVVMTGTFLFGGERSPIPEKDVDLRELLSLLQAIEQIEGALGDPSTQYLRAVIEWRLRQENSARELWTNLARETAFSDPRRIVKHHIWTESGQPKLFHGRIVSADVARGKARVQVDGLHQDIELLQRDFSGLELRRGANVKGGFNIAFNYIGPVAVAPGRRGGIR